MIHIVLLSGGSGARLWPLSNSARSKQFLKVLQDESGNHVSMVQRVLRQIESSHAEIDITIATNVQQVDVLNMQVGVGRTALVIEPARRDTAPAIMLACAHLDLVQGGSADDPVLVMPIDTYAEQRYFDQIPRIADVVASGRSDLVLLGAKPTYPSEKYGYIMPATPDLEGCGPFEVESFKEKPSEQVAVEYISRGALWNTGVFGFKLGWMRGLTKRYIDPDTYEEFVASYDSLPKVSFDYEVVERTRSIVVMPYEGTWKDLGTWNTLTEEMADATSGKVWLDEASTSNINAINETNLPVVVAGISDAVVVATPDGILVSGKEASAHIKGLVAEASLYRPMYERRQWGEYRVLDASDYADGTHTLTKELVLDPGRQLSYQRHDHRSEIWTIVDGTGTVVLDGAERDVRVGDCVHIAPGQLHAIRATERLHIIEIQVGWPLVEEDIERFGFHWE